MQTILIVDDDTAIGDLEQEVLERAGYAVQRACSGTETLLLLRHRRPDLVLLEHIGADTPDCTESSLKTHISHLRAKLRAVSGRNDIEAVWGIGFRLRV